MHVKRDGNRIRVHNNSGVKEIRDRDFGSDEKAWVVPYSKENATLLGLHSGELCEALIKTTGPQNQIPLLPMPIKSEPYQHQVSAFNFICTCFGLSEKRSDGEVMPMSTIKKSYGCALLMEM